MLLRSTIIEETPLPILLGKLNSQISKIKGITLPDRLDPKETAPEFKNAGNLWYNDSQHIYFKRSTLTPVISVTTLLSVLCEPFNENLKSFQCANKDYYTCDNLDVSNWNLISILERQERILRAWKITNVTGTTYGSMAHLIFEHGAKNRNLPAIDTYNYGRDRFQLDHPIIQYFLQDLLNNYFPKFACFEVFTEPLLQLCELIAGQADLVLIDHQRKLIHILDYKTNKHKPGSLEDKSYGKFKFIIPHVKDHSITHYQLQLCLYQLMVLQLYPGYGLGSNFLLWGNRNTGMFETIEINPMDHYNDAMLIYNYLEANRGQIYSTGQLN